jgi:uncharacterized membrane protein YbhN (UPF0104 family)
MNSRQVRTQWQQWLPWIGALLGLTALAWVLRGFDLDRFRAILTNADTRPILLVPIVVVIEQVVRGWKWRQLLWPLRQIGTLYLFGAIMAGYLLAVLVPFGFGTVARSWLVARRERLNLPGVLATVALDRLTDGIVFVCLIPIALLFAPFPDPRGVRLGLILGGGLSVVLFTFLIADLALYRSREEAIIAWLSPLVDRLPVRVSSAIRHLMRSFAEGITWPRQAWRGAGIIVASILMKLFASMQFFWAGVAFGITLRASEYLFVLVFLGFLVIIGHFARIAGGFTIGAVFVLSLLGVRGEEALAMTLIVQASNLLTVAGIGALALWLQGIAIADARGAVET